MSNDNEEKDSTETRVDRRLARPRLKEGLIPADSGIFLRIEVGNEKGRTFDLSRGGTYLIGRDGADIALDDAKISRKHVEISLLGPDAYFLRDLASTNGTFINGKRLQDWSPLRHEDRIRVGDTVLFFAIVEGSIRISR